LGKNSVGVNMRTAQKIKMGSDIPQKWRGGHWLTYKRKLKMTPEQKIRQLVEQIYKLDITNNCRESRFVQARLIYYKLCIQFGTLNQTNIAKSIGRNHATLIHAMKQWDVYIRFFKGFEKNYFFARAALLEAKMFPNVKKRITLDELLIKYNELMVENEQLKINLGQSKKCKCGKCVL
jgi:hypothetical protein